MTTACTLARVAVYSIAGNTKFQSFKLVISRGSVVDFSYPSNPRWSAIVNAANEGCLGGGGVDGAISDAGGDNLHEDRLALPAVRGVRCHTGDAVITGPNSYGELNVPFVIHAVGPNYMTYFNDSELPYGDKLLSSAYYSSLECGKQANLKAIAFSLLSAGVFRGARTLKEVLQIGLQTISKYDGYSELEEVHMCAFTRREQDILIQAAHEIGLIED